MSRANEIYNYERMIEREIERIGSIDDVNKETILRYHNHGLAEGISPARIRKRIATARLLSSIFGKRFEDATKEDIVQLVRKIEQKKIAESTKRDYKAFLKHFYRWLRNSDVNETPPEVKWIRSGYNVCNKILKKDLLTVEEANRIVECADGIQYKALFSVLFDSGRRLGEILGLRVGDIEFDELGAKLRVDGKVGPDVVRISASEPRLATWLDNHPEKDNPLSPLWITVRKGKVKQVTYSWVQNKLKKAVAKTGIKKRVWLYLLRHSRITPASTKLTYSELCHVFGWRQGSKMPMFYVHLAGDDRDNAFLKMNGLEPVNGHSENSNYVPIVCSRCKRNNSPDAKYCNGCGLAFDLKFALEVDQRKGEIKDKIDRLSTELAKSPEIVDLLLKAASLMNNKKTN